MRQETKPFGQTDFKAMKDGCQKKLWKLENERVPSRIYVEKLGHCVEKGVLRAELLSEVTNGEERGTDLMKAAFDSSGKDKAIKASTSVPLPRGLGEPRARDPLSGGRGRLSAFNNLVARGCMGSAREFSRTTSTTSWARAFLNCTRAMRVGVSRLRLPGI